MIPGRNKGRRNLAPLPSPLPYFYAVDEDAQLTYREAEVFMETELERSNRPWWERADLPIYTHECVKNPVDGAWYELRTVDVDMCGRRVVKPVPCRQDHHSPTYPVGG